jgi:hypothetical protein
MDQELSLGCLSDSINAQHVIKVGVGRDDARWCGVDVLDETYDSFWLVAGIDN